MNTSKPPAFLEHYAPSKPKDAEALIHAAHHGGLDENRERQWKHDYNALSKEDRNRVRRGLANIAYTALRTERQARPYPWRLYLILAVLMVAAWAIAQVVGAALHYRQEWRERGAQGSVHLSPKRPARPILWAVLKSPGTDREATIDLCPGDLFRTGPGHFYGRTGIQKLNRRSDLPDWMRYPSPPAKGGHV